MTGRDAPPLPAGYRVLHRLGSGRTAHVHLAEHARFGRVALKLPRPELEARPVLRRMFEGEVMITLRLDHARVVRALDGHPTGPGAFLALEVCAGGTLDGLLLERGRLPVDRALRLVEDVAEGLAYAHGQGVLHRDVKPANVFLTEDDRAKLGDFGTGVFMPDDGDDRVGTAFYMAPEIFEGAAATVRSDVYGLGVLAFEVITGDRPFRGDSYDALMHAHLGGLPRDPAAARSDLSREVSAVVRTAMARRAERRYESVDAFLRALREALPDRSDGADDAPPAGRAGRRRRDASDGASAEREGDEGRRGRGGLWRLFRRGDEGE